MTLTIFLLIGAVINLTSGQETITFLSLDEITTKESSLTSTEKITTSTASSSTSTPKLEDLLPEGFEFNRTEFKPVHFCTCDLTIDACDVNCCCDIDCSTEDVKAFSTCQDVQAHNYNPRFCYTTQIHVENNTQFLLEKVNSDPLFCIIDTNLEESFMYFDKEEPVTNVTYFDNMKLRHRSYLWPQLSHDKLKQPMKKMTQRKNTTASSRPLDHYRAGDPILALVGTDKQTLSLPMQSFFDAKCSAFAPVQYMHSAEQKCQVIIEPGSDCSQIPQLNAINYVSGLKILSKVNQTLNNDLENEFLTPKPEVCINLDNDDRVCVELALNEALSEPTKSCENVLNKLKFEIFHDGIHGIKKVKALIEMSNLSARLSKATDSISFTQTFAYVHYWSNENITTQLDQRSGNPGYIIGKPILTGILALKDLNQVLNSGDSTSSGTSAPMTEKDLYIDRGQDDISQYLTVMTSTCQDYYQRQKVEFGINMRVSCLLFKTRKEISSTCQYLRKHIFDILIGQQDIKKRSKRTEDTNFQLLTRQRVAMFGNSKTSHPQDWIEVMLTNMPQVDFFSNLDLENAGEKDGECRSVITDLHLEIFHASVGSQANPQSKILGVNYVFSPPKDVIFQCNGLKCRLANASQPIEISTSVGFIDVTQPALPHFKEKPVLEAKLPHDFFYPFLKSYQTSGANPLILNSFISMICLLVVF